jgi:hypothetical protein
MFNWDKSKNRNCKLSVPKGFTFDLKNDEVVLAIDEPGFMTDRTRESLRKSKNGQLYLHTDNDRERECITTDGEKIGRFCERNEIET